MANKKVSQLTSKPSVLVTDLFPIADPSTGQLYKTTISDLGTAIGSGVSSVNGLVGAVVLDTDDIQELVSPTNKWFTDTRARAALSASSPLAYNSGTGVFSIPAATSSQNGYLTSTDWTTFNSKVSGSGDTGYYARWTSAGVLSDGFINTDSNITYVSGVGLTTLSGLDIQGNFGGGSGGLKLKSYDETTGKAYMEFFNTSGNFRLGLEGSTGGGILPGSTAYATVLTTGLTAKNLEFGTNNAKRLTLDGTTGAATFTSSVTASALYVTGMTAGSGAIYHTGSRLTFANYNASGTLHFEVNGGTGALTINSDTSATFESSVGIGTSSLTGYNLRVTKNITGATASYGVVNDGVIQSGVTSSASYFFSNASTSASAFTVTNLYHFHTAQSTIGAGSTVTNQTGFFASSSLTGATNNYGFWGNIPAGTNRWNFYAPGTANNYMAGSLGIGGTSLTNVNIRVSRNITGGTDGYGILVDSTVQSDVTSNAYVFRSLPATTNLTFTLGNLYHFSARQNTIGASSTITNQYGFTVESNLTSATNNYGFYGNIPSGTNRWNIYMAGTANNHLAGNLLIGSTADNGSKLQVTGAATFSSSVTASGLIAKGTGSFNVNNNIRFLRGTGTEMGYIGWSDETVNNSTWLFKSSNGNPIALSADGINQQFILTTAGNVGIGTTAPTDILHLARSGTGVYNAIHFTNPNSTADFYVGMGGSAVSNSSLQNNAYLYNVGNSAIVMATNDTERMRITSGGNVLIGTTSATPVSSNVIGINLSSGAQIQSSVDGRAVLLNRINDNGVTMEFHRGGTSVGNISVTTVSTTYNVTSDYRLKEDLQPINGLEIVNKIKVYDYKWKSEDSRMDGVLAHELAEVLPYAVTGVKDGEQMQSVDYSKIVPVMVQAIKDLKAELDTLKNK
jgi:hypothetical protein